MLNLEFVLLSLHQLSKYALIHNGGNIGSTNLNFKHSKFWRETGSTTLNFEHSKFWWEGHFPVVGDIITRTWKNISK
jgi:hypothetical protein